MEDNYDLNKNYVKTAKKVDPEKHIITHGIYNNRYIPLTFKGSYKEFFKLMNLDKNSIIKIKNTYVNKKSVQNDGKKKIINTSAKKANIQPKKKDEDANKTLILKLKAESDAKIKLAIKKNGQQFFIPDTNQNISENPVLFKLIFNLIENKTKVNEKYV